MARRPWPKQIAKYFLDHVQLQLSSMLHVAASLHAGRKPSHPIDTNVYLFICPASFNLLHARTSQLSIPASFPFLHACTPSRLRQVTWYTWSSEMCSLFNTSSVPVLTLRYSFLYCIIVVLYSSLLFAHLLLCYLRHLQIRVGLRSFCSEPHRSKIEIVWTQPQS